MAGQRALGQTLTFLKQFFLPNILSYRANVTLLCCTECVLQNSHIKDTVSAILWCDQKEEHEEIKR